MSNINGLIQQYCPNGVEHSRLGDLGNFYGGITGKSKADFTDGNAKFISYMNVYSNLSVNQNTNDTVKIGTNEKQRTLQYCDVCFTGSSETPDECGFSSVVTEVPTESLYLNSFCFFFRFDEPEKFNPHFLKHLFRDHDLRKQIGKTANGVTRFNVSKELMKAVTIPVPPLPVQEEIVRILDKFTELEQELEQELELRKKQYEYYRDKMLSSEDVKFVSTKSLCEDNFWLMPQTPQYISEDGVKYITSKNIKNGRIDFSTAANISEEVYAEISKNRCVKKGDFLITMIGTIGECAIVESDEHFYGQNLYLLRLDTTKVNRKYYKYCFENYRYTLQGKKNNGNQGYLKAGSIDDLSIPLPSLDEQNHIVEILDKFSTLTEDISEGLPAEIKMRHQQYEYYRDKLLNFKRLEVV